MKYIALAAAMAVTLGALASPALADSMFSSFQRNNVGEVAGAKMVLPASSVPPFEITCVASAQGYEPYRRLVFIDPTTSSLTRCPPR